MKKSDHAFTLIEILMVRAILMLTSATVFATFGPAREKARQQRCIGNLRQINLALTMYRHDNGGIDPEPGAKLSPARAGLPNTLGALSPAYIDIHNKSIIHCPDYDPSRDKLPFLVSYRVNLADEHIPEAFRISTIMAERGGETPLIVCEDHNRLMDIYKEPRWTLKYVIILRLNGQIKAKQVPLRQPFPTW